MRYNQTDIFEAKQREESNKIYSGSASKRKKIFELSPRMNQKRIQLSTKEQEPNISDLGSRIYQIIDNLNTKLVAYESVKAENYFLRQQNATLQNSSNTNFENLNLKREKDQLANELFDIKKKMSKGKTLCQKIRDEKDLSKLQELSDIFEL